MTLREYDRKRNFQLTPEPPGGGKAAGKKKGAWRRFVIQKHAASHLHFDFRLELEGVLKSWAVPKGPPLKKGGKALAVQVEDHPVGYLLFEGIIPQGEYGGGTVMVWDHGVFEPLSAAPLKELKSGKLHLRLHGQKLDGEWYLVRIKDEKEWLLIKAEQDHSAAALGDRARSALTGRTMEQIAGKTGKTGQAPLPATAANTVKKKRAAGSSAGIPVKKPSFLKPMMAVLRDQAPPGNWSYELKFDGWRALALIHGAEVSLLSRNGTDLTAKFPEITGALARMNLTGTVLDGEIVALDAQGRSSFQKLQAYDLGTEKPPLLYYIFDCPQLRGIAMAPEPLEKRQEALSQILKREPADGVLRYSEPLGGNAALLLKKTARLGLEGLIGKKKGSLYEAGRRSGSWIKLKLHVSQELVIGGWTPPAGSRKHFGALIVGYYEGSRLRCAGKVGTGFSAAMLKEISALLLKKESPQCPFADLPVSGDSRWGQALTAKEMKRCRWVKPGLVCQVKFAEWTRDGRLRQPVFLGLREDKRAGSVRREAAATS